MEDADPVADRDAQHVPREPGQNSDGSALRDAQQRLRWYDEYARRALWSYPKNEEVSGSTAD